MSGSTSSRTWRKIRRSRARKSNASGRSSLSALRVGCDDPEFLANLVFDRLVYGFHPYGRPRQGTPQTLAAITRNDLLAFHKKWFGANNAILAIVGDVTADEAFAGAERAFGKWAQAGVEVSKPIDPPQPARRVVVIDKPGSVQTEIRVGNIAIPRKHDDFMALDLAAKVLGGEGANRLHRVAVERGLTYGAVADFNALKQSGDIVAETNTKSETTGETLRLIVDEIWKIIREPVGDRELEGAQEYQTGSFPLTIETPSQIALQVLNAVFFGLNMNDLQTYRERVNAVRVEDIQRVARNYLRPDRLTIVLVGDAASFVKQLPGRGLRQVRGRACVRARSCRCGFAPEGCASPGWLSAGLLPRAPQRRAKGVARQGDCRAGRPRAPRGHQDREGRRLDDIRDGGEAGDVRVHELHRVPGEVPYRRAGTRRQALAGLRRRASSGSMTAPEPGSWTRPQPVRFAPWWSVTWCDC